MASLPPWTAEHEALLIQQVGQAQIDRALFAHFAVTHQPKLLRALPRDLPLQVQKEIVQATFLDFHRSCTGWKDRGVPIYGWLKRVAKNKAIDHFRKHSTHREVGVEADVADERAGPDEPLAARQLKARLWAWLPQVLTPAQLPVFQQYYGEDEPTLAQVADRLGLTLDAAKAHHRRGKRRLQAALADASNTGPQDWAPMPCR